MKNHIAAALLTSVIATPASAQACRPFVEIVQILWEGYGEILLGYGSGEDHATAVFVNQETGTWTIVDFYQAEHACLASSGVNFQFYTGPIPGQDEAL